MQEAEAAVKEALAPFDRAEGENPYTVQHDLQDMMQDLVGIIRTGPELDGGDRQARRVHRAREEHLGEGRPRLQPRLEPGDRPAGDAHGLALDGARGESAQGVARRPHPRGLPEPRPRVREVQLRASPSDGGEWDSPITAAESPLLPMPDELKALLEEAH